MTDFSIDYTETGMVEADLDPDSDLDTRVRNLTRKVDESQARCDGLRNRLDGIDARLAEPRRQVKDIADQYEGDAARIVGTATGAASGWIGGAAANAKYDESVGRGNGDNYWQHFKDNVAFGEVN